ncbi:MAG TPA: 2-oxoglutarate dehydrogenase E1 component [Gaiellaceae bacterium]|nr:2-oxoglutarate dehydrogenase E1 component [Gaiellaceae bacterium]
MHDVDGVNAGYARLLLDEYLDNPEAVPAEWRALFEAGDSAVVRDLPGLSRLLERLPRDGADGGNGHLTAVTSLPTAAQPQTVPAATQVAAAPRPSAEEAVEEELLGGVAAAMALVKAHRMHGHLAAHLDPLGSEPVGDPALDPLRLEPTLTPELQARIPASLLRVHVGGESLAEALPHLNETYCGSMAYEIEHISEHQQRVWLRKAIESWRFRTPLAADEKRRLYSRLCEVEGMERYLRRSFLGQKQFSLEGIDVLIPMLDETFELASAAGARQAVLGMAHRGRLNVLAHTIGLPYEQILREFEGERTIEVVAADAEGGTGDVKYHLGAEGVRSTASGTITVTLAANPSHLEAVNPVVEGMTRADQTDRTSPNGAHDPTVALPILLHGDAAFAGQGIVAETFNLYALEGYSTGGTLHLITNNQVGFTTDPAQGRSTRYSSDLAKGFDTPIVHVNADDPEAAISAVRLALAYRARFGHDIVIDLVGYRRFGHNEQDEPAYTQPIMAAQIERHPTVRELYGARLVEQGILSEAEATSEIESVAARLHEAHDRLRSSFGQAIPAKSHDEAVPPGGATAVDTGVRGKRLRRFTEQLMNVPDGFTIHPKLERQLERRLTALDDGTIDWGHAESLAFASLLRDGIPVRLTGQDTERGTFSQRHLVLHDAVTGEIEIPMQHLKSACASFEVYNSPLSEYACVGFEYGYSTAAPEALVLWEAQFGDFANGAQTIVDQFISSGLAKWRQTSRLTLLLPHGYEGNGPEHSSARLERFLQLAAQENIRIANCTTSAQYFHLLRRQALDPIARPLVVMTPKGLLRLKDASSSLAELTDGSFRPILDAAVDDKATIRRLVFCTGKIYYDIVGHEAARDSLEIAVARIEQLYPFPVEPARSLIASYPALDEIVWAQEEPQNMGAWRSIRHRLEEAAGGAAVRYVGRPWRASTAEGYPTAHSLEQERIALAVLT